MKYFLPIIFIFTGIGIPVFHTIKNSNPKNVFKNIIEQLRNIPMDLWPYYFTQKGLDRWMSNSLKIEEISNVEIIDCYYKNFIWEYKIKFLFKGKEENYTFKLVKNPDANAKSRWVINDIERTIIDK